jgi:hypothetical protein
VWKDNQPQRVASLALVSVVISCHVAAPAPEVRASPGSVTGAAADAIGDDGLFVLPSPVDEGFPQISAEQAQALAAAWVRRFALMGLAHLEREYGRPLDLSRLQECRLVFARSPYQPLPAEAPLALRNLVAAKFLVTFCSGSRPAVSAALGDAPEPLPVLSARASPGEPETLRFPLSYRADAPQGFAPLTLTSRCLTNADTAAVHIRAVTQTVTRGDSASLVALGLPFRPPEGVSLVRDPQVCDRMIDAYNGLVPNDEHPGRISSAYILKIADSAYALALNPHGSVHAFLDARLRLPYVSAGL